MGSRFTVAFEQGEWTVAINTPPAPQWALTFQGNDDDLWTQADAILEARKVLIGYSLRRDQPGLLPEVRAQFRALPSATDIARCEFATIE